MRGNEMENQLLKDPEISPSDKVLKDEFGTFGSS
jgi:hypothetical protein